MDGHTYTREAHEHAHACTQHTHTDLVAETIRRVGLKGLELSKDPLNGFRGQVLRHDSVPVKGDGSCGMDDWRLGADFGTHAFVPGGSNEKVSCSVGKWAV